MAGCSDALTSKAVFHTGGTCCKRSAYDSLGSRSPTSIRTPLLKISAISPFRHLMAAHQVELEFSER
jgi:hypothetical protein